MSDPHILHLEDFTEGQVIELGVITASADDILAFGRAFDPQSFHTDPEAAGNSPFHGLIASGWHTAALFMRLYVDRVLSRSACLGSPGVSDLRWRAPVRPDQRLHGRVTVERIAPSGRHPDRGTMWPLCELRDDSGVVVFSMVLVTLLARRTSPPAATQEDKADV